jgi:hypothetical protein
MPIIRPCGLISAGLAGPTSISNIAAWWRSDLGITLNGSTVSAWADQTGNGHHWTQGTAANQPTYTAGQLNGQPGVVFDGSNDYMDAVNSVTLALTKNIGAISMWVVAKNTNTDTQRILCAFSNGISTDTSRVSLRWRATSGNGTGDLALGTRRLDADTAQTERGGTISTTVFDSILGILDYTNSNAFLYQNNTLVRSTTTFQTDGNTSNTNSVGVHLGWGGVGGNCAMSVVEMAIWLKVLTSNDRDILDAYIANRYGI